jgi:hypothetical protein
MQEEDKTCQVEMLWGKPCGRQCLPNDDRCICHSEDPDKDQELFEIEVENQLERDDVHDFTRFVFPDGCNFAEVTFTGRVDFQGAEFKGDANFFHATFTGDANFLAATFTGYAEFEEATFKGDAKFWDATFTGDADFAECHVTEKAHVRFDSEYREDAMFAREASFCGVRIDDGARLTFRKMSLDKCRFLETDLTRVEFREVEWHQEPRDARWLQWLLGFLPAQLKNVLMPPFDWLFDEIGSKKYKPVAQSYRQLQANYGEKYHYRQAGSFHIGEQEMMRKGYGKVRQYLCAAFFYRVVSLYGESYGRPLFWLGSVLLGFPAYLLFDGIMLRSSIQDLSVRATNYEWSWSLSDFLLFKADYWNTFFMNLSFVTWNRSAISSHLPDWYQRGFVTGESMVMAVLVTFSVLALRRQFKRKSF